MKLIISLLMAILTGFFVVSSCGKIGGNGDDDDDDAAETPPPETGTLALGTGGFPAEGDFAELTETEAIEASEGAFSGVTLLTRSWLRTMRT